MAADSDSERSNTDASQEPEGLDPDITRYVAEIELYEKDVQKWNTQCKRILRRYKDDRGGDGTIESQQRRFNALWSNTQNLKPILYARNPKPDIQRRFKDADPIGRVTSDVLERCANYFCDTDHFMDVSSQCVMDYLLPGRGTSWLRYVPHFKPADELTDSVGPGDDDKELAQAPDVIDYEEVVPDYIHRSDFGHNICRTYDEVWLVWRIAYLTRAQIKERFTNLTPAQVAEIPTDYKRRDLDGKQVDDGTEKAVIYEAWDKVRKVALWFHKSRPGNEAMDIRPDPLRLDGFFPCPRPMLANLVNDSLIPTPLYVEYQDQAAELDMLTQRIAQMTKTIKAVGVYDASVEGLNRMFNEGVENELIPVTAWALFAEKGGMNGVMSMLDTKALAETLLSLYEAREKVKQDLDQITGISDIVRGATDPNETATAQRLKSGYGNQRISDMQREVQRFIRETVRIMVDIIAGHFQIDTIKQISGVRLLTAQEKQAYQAAQQPQQPPQPGMPPAPPPPMPPGVSPEQMQDMLANPTWEDVEQLLRNDAMRCFRIDIETDSTIKMDEEADKASRIEFIAAIGKYLSEAVPAAENTPELAPVLLQGLMFLARGFPVGKEMEGTLNAAVQKLERLAANPKPKPNPEMMKIQGEQQLSQQKMQQDGQIAQAKIQAEQVKAQGDLQVQQAQLSADLQTGAAKLQQEKELEQYKTQMQAQTDQRENMMEAQREAAKLEQESQLAKMKLDSTMQLELAKAHIQQQTAIEVARINAKATAGAEEEAVAVESVKEDDEDMKNSKEILAKMDQLMQHLSKPQPDMTGAINNLADAHKQNTASIANLHKAVTSEKEIVRDPKTGKPSGVRIKQDPKQLAQELRN